MDIRVIGDRGNEAALRRHWPAGHRVDVVPISSLYVAWDGSRLELVRSDTLTSLGDYDAAYLIGWGRHAAMARVIAFYLVQHGVPSLNTDLFDTWPVTKLAELCRLTAAGVRHPRTICTQDARNTLPLCLWAEKTIGLGLPLIVKAIAAAHGNMNFRIEKSTDTIPLDTQATYVIQECIPNRGDWRIVVMGGRPTVAIWRERKSDDTHLNNTSKGGTATVVDLDKVDNSVLDISVRAAAAMGRSDLAGVDVMVHAETELPYVLEVNMNPDIVVGAPDESDVKVKLAAVFAELERRVAAKAPGRVDSAKGPFIADSG